MRARWLSHKRSVDGGIAPTGDTLDGADDSISLVAAALSPDDVEHSMVDEQCIFGAGSDTFHSDFMEPTPKALPKDNKKPRVEIVDLDDDPVICDHEPETSTKFNKDTLELNSFDSTNFRPFKQPWEKGRLNKLFGKQPNFGRSVPSLEASGSCGWALKVGWKDQAIESATISAVDQIESKTIFQSVVRSAPELDYFEEREAKRTSAVASWWDLLSPHLTESAVGRQVIAEATVENADDYGRELLDATFGIKSPSTLLKRFYALKAYATWCSDVKMVNWLPIQESDVWSYMRWLKATEAPPTKATSLVEAIRFGWYIVGLSGAGEVQGSLRLKGIASQLFIKKKPWRPAALLEVKEIIAIHRFLEDETKDVVDRVFAGHLLHLLYVRGRWSDLAAVQHGEVDEDGMFFELSTQHHKGAKGQETKSRLLPLVAPCRGITGTNWCKTYLAVREKAGLQLPQEVPLAMLLAPARNCGMDWTSRALTSQEGTDFMRKLLQLPSDASRRVSTHSLKSTAISWCSKYGLGFESRALLSRHISAVANPTALYSRDLISAVMREFCQVIDLIAQSRFEPDRTRSGMLTPMAQQTPRTPVGPSSASRLLQQLFEEGEIAAPEVMQPDEEKAVGGPEPFVEAEVMPSVSDIGAPVPPGEVRSEERSDEDVSESSESDPSVYTSSEEDEQPSAVVHAAFERPPDPMLGDYFINNKSLVIHLVSRPGVFRCGRKLGWLYTKVPELNGIRCTKCFNV